jgi:hypothetical protein
MRYLGIEAPSRSSLECQNWTHLPKQIQILGTPMLSRDDTGTRGRDVPVEKLKVINVARRDFGRSKTIPE